MVWPFWKTRRVKCKGGSEKTVYRNVDDAFPLYIPGCKASLASQLNVEDIAKSGITAEYASAIQGLVFRLDELNQGLMMQFRGAYVVYQNDPCLHGQFFQREVGKLLEDQRRLQAYKIQIDGLVSLAKLGLPGSASEFVKLYAAIIDRIGSMDGMGSALAAQVTRQQIAEARTMAQEMTVSANDE